MNPVSFTFHFDVLIVRIVLMFVMMFLCVQERRWKFPLGTHENLAGALSRQGVQVRP